MINSLQIMVGLALLLRCLKNHIQQKEIGLLGFEPTVSLVVIEVFKLKDHVQGGGVKKGGVRIFYGSSRRHDRTIFS